MYYTCKNQTPGTVTSGLGERFGWLGIGVPGKRSKLGGRNGAPRDDASLICLQYGLSRLPDPPNLSRESVRPSPAANPHIFVHEFVPFLSHGSIGMAYRLRLSDMPHATISLPRHTKQ